MRWRLGADRSERRTLEIANGLNDLAILLRTGGDPAAAEGVVREGLAMRRTLLPVPSGPTPQANDNRTPASTPRVRILTLDLAARPASWYPSSAAPHVRHPATRSCSPRPARDTRRHEADALHHDMADVAYGFVLQGDEMEPAPDSVRIPGSPLLLRRGEPPEIVVHNRLGKPLSSQRPETSIALHAKRTHECAKLAIGAPRSSTICGGPCGRAPSQTHTSHSPEAPMNRLISLLCLFGSVLSTGCHDNLAGPGAVDSILEPDLSTHVAARGGAPLVQLHLSPVPLPTPTPYVLRVAGVLNGFGEPGGSVSLWNPGDATQRYHYKLQEGEVRCEGGTPVAQFSGEGFMTDNRGRAQGFPFEPKLFKHDYNFSIPASTSGRSSDGAVLVTLEEGEPADLVGETFLIEFDRAFFSPEICATR